MARERVTAIVQARMSSTRLPGKVLTDIGGRPAVLSLIDRLRRSVELDSIVLATSDEAADDPVAEAARADGVDVARGPLDDVLERFRLAAEVAGSPDAIVRLTADCPVMDPEVVDLVVARWRSGREDYVTNTLDPRSFPDGLDVEVLSRSALERSAAESVDPVEREHVSTYVRRRPDAFTHVGIFCEPNFGEVRATLDTPEDLELLRRVADEIGPSGGIRDLLRALGHGDVSLSYRA